jgi:hypothetical protein
VADYAVPYPCTDADHLAIWRDSLPLIADTAQQHIVEGSSALNDAGAKRLEYRFGAVRARFVIDTLGRVVPGSGFIEATSDEQFARAVCTALPRLRWQPVMVNGQKAVVGLVHVSFDYRPVK